MTRATPPPDETLPTADAHASPPLAAVEVGTVLAGRYYLEALLGRGGSGAVFRAADSAVGEQVALKVLHPDRARDRSWVRRLVREVKVARAIRHPNVCRVLELGQSDGHWFITMELAQSTLRDRLRDPARTWPVRLADARAVCAGLSAIHAIGFTHRDVTPQNVLSMPDGRLVISDFGLALADQETTTMYGGTPNYLPPEVMRGVRSDQRSDVWQLGVVLHEILFGRRPEWQQHQSSLVLNIPVVTGGDVVLEEIVRLIRDCLATIPDHRPQTAIAVAGRLAAAESARPRGWWTRQWIRARGWTARHRRRLLTTGAAAAFVAISVSGFRAANRPALCGGGPERAAVAWNDAAKSKISTAFQSSKEPYAADAFAGVTRILDDYSQRWSRMYTDTCEATHVRGDQSTDVLDLRMICLNDRLEEMKALSGILAQADAEAIARAVTAASSIRPLDHCANVPALRAGIQPPRDPSLRKKVETLRRELVEVQARFETGAWEEGARRAAKLTSSAEELGYQPLLGQSLFVWGLLLTDVSDVLNARQHLERSVYTATASGDDETVAAASSTLVFVLAETAQFDAAETWGHLADATLRRLNGNDRIRGWLLNNRGILRLNQGRFIEAVADFQQAIAFKTNALGPNHPDVARSLTNLALVYRELGRYSEAVATIRHSNVINREAVGEAHPIVARNLINIGEILVDAGRIAEARAELQKGIAIIERTRRDDVLLNVWTLVTVGRCDLAEGRLDAALPRLERAMALRATVPLVQTVAGSPPFALARALWPKAANRARALRLAMQARDEYRRFGNIKYARKVEEWLLGHRLAPESQPR